MDNNEKLRDRIKKSLENASSTIELKQKIEKDIVNILNIISDLTNGEIGFDINDNNPANPSFSASNSLVFLKKANVNFAYGFNILGYSLSNTAGYPVTLETETQYYDCNNEDELKDVMASIIDAKSLQIIQLMSEEIDNIPF